ncbi:MAG: hypothetical protein GX621_12505, partial [Pirellulaceae bacterium]|nr:hypothetical protein [Pirellulaceae bacterium]
MDIRSFKRRVCRFAMMTPALCLLLVIAAWADETSQGDKQGDNAARMPMPVDEDSAAETRWRNKTVQDSRLLDDMENPATWSHVGPGSMEFTTQRCRDGKQSVRLTSPTVLDNVPDICHQRMYGQTLLRRSFAKEDWSGYNRLSFWVYPTLPGFNTICMSVLLLNDGQMEGGPGQPTRGSLHYVLLKPNQWNHVVWEIPHLTRDKVTSVDFIYRLQGNEPGAATTVCYDFDQLEVRGRQIAGNGRFRAAGPIARVAESDPSRRNVPTLVMIR